jgi:hypothetical protein
MNIEYVSVGIKKEGDMGNEMGDGGAGRNTRTPFFKSTFPHLLKKSFLHEARLGLLAFSLGLLQKISSTEIRASSSKNPFI